MRQAWRNARIVGAVVLLLLVGLLVYLTRSPQSWLGTIGTAVDDALVPLQRGATRVGHAVAAGAAQLRSVASLRRERDRLAREAARVSLLEAQLDEARQENARLRALLSFRSSLEGRWASPPLTAQVIGRNPERWFSYVTVAAGRRQGVELYSPVLAAGGLVGRVTRVGEDSSQVLLLTDPRSGVGVRSRHDRRAAGVVLGRGGRDGLLVLRLFRSDAEVKRGDLLVTSGLGEVFPPGLPVGRIGEVYRGEGGLVLYARVTPAADLDRLTEVLILPGGPAAGAER